MKKSLLAGAFLSIIYAQSSHAQCTSFPYTLTNGQSADASQVMADYTYLANCLAPRNGPTFTGTANFSNNGTVHGIAYDDGNLHISGVIGNLWLDAGSNPVAINNQSNGNVIITNGTGNVGIGTSAPVFPLDVQSTRTGNYSNMGCSTTYGALFNTGTNTFSCSGAAGISVSIRASGRIVAPEVDSISDMRLKDFVGDLKPTTSLETISRLRPLMFTWKPNAGQQDEGLKVGFFAQEVAAQIPAAVMRGPGVLPDQYFLNYEAIIPYLVAAVQELSIQNQRLKARFERRDALVSYPEVTNTFTSNPVQVNAHILAGAISSTMNPDTTIISQDETSALVPALLAAYRSQQAEIDELRFELRSLKSAH